MKPTGDKVFNGVLLFIFALFVFMAVEYDPAPRRIPLLVGVPALALATWCFVGTLRLKADAKTETTTVTGDTQAAQAAKRRGLRYPQEASFLLWLAIFYLLSYLGGFAWSVPAFLFLLLYGYFKERVILAVVYSAVMSLLTYLLFAVVFHINLYRGIILILLRQVCLS